MVIAALVFAFAIGWIARGQFEEDKQYLVSFDDSHKVDWQP